MSLCAELVLCAALVAASRSQAPFVLAVVAAYVIALALGMRGSLPLPYGLVAILGSAVTSVLGAIFLDLHRRAIFTQRLLLEQSRDRQLAMLYDVSRTVTAGTRIVIRVPAQPVVAARAAAV